MKRQLLASLILFSIISGTLAQDQKGRVLIDSIYSQNLENSGISHIAEEYIGTHGSGIYTKEGRIPNQMLPFFDLYLEFE